MLINDLAAILAVTENEKRRKEEDDYWELDRLKREATIKSYRNQNKYQFSCSTESAKGSCSFTEINSFNNKSIENE